MNYYINFKFPRKVYKKKFYLNILLHQYYDNSVVWAFPKSDYEFIFPTNIFSHRFLLLLIMMADINSPMMALVKIFADKNPKLIFPSTAKTRTKIPTILYGSTKGHKTGLNGCIGMSSRMWNTFPSIQDNSRAGVNLHTSFVLTLSRRKDHEVKIGYSITVTKVEIIVPIASAPIKLCKMK